VDRLHPADPPDVSGYRLVTLEDLRSTDRYDSVTMSAGLLPRQAAQPWLSALLGSGGLLLRVVQLRRPEKISPPCAGLEPPAKG